MSYSAEKLRVLTLPPPRLATPAQICAVLDWLLGALREAARRDHDMQEVLERLALHPQVYLRELRLTLEDKCLESAPYAGDAA